MLSRGWCGVAVAQPRDRMKPCVLIAASPMLNRRLADALAATFTVMVCSEPERAEVLIAVACFQAVVIADEFVAAPEVGDDVPVVRVATTADPAKVRDEVIAAVDRRKADEQRRAGELSKLTELKYDEYIELVRFRATRRYLLGLMMRYRGSVTDASRSAGMVRESLHRLLRRHDVEAERFRENNES